MINLIENKIQAIRIVIKYIFKNHVSALCILVCFSTPGHVFVVYLLNGSFMFRGIVYKHMHNQSVCAMVNGKNTKCISSRNNEHTLVVSRLLNYILLSFAKKYCKITFGNRQTQLEVILFCNNRDNNKCVYNEFLLYFKWDDTFFFLRIKKYRDYGYLEYYEKYIWYIKRSTLQ